jgi:hypothetical protein
MSTRSKKVFLGNRARPVLTTVNLTAVNRLSRQCGILNISQPYRPPRPVTGITLFYGDGVCFLWGTNWTVSTATSSSIAQLTVSRLSRQCGILNISQPYRPPRPVTGFEPATLEHCCTKFAGLNPVCRKIACRRLPRFVKKVFLSLKTCT